MQMGCFDDVPCGYFRSPLNCHVLVVLKPAGVEQLAEVSRRKSRPSPPHTLPLQSTWMPAICSHINIHHPTRSKQHQHTLTFRIPEHISRRITEHARSISQALRSLWYLKSSILNPSVTMIQC